MLKGSVKLLTQLFRSVSFCKRLSSAFSRELNPGSDWGGGGHCTEREVLCVQSRVSFKASCIGTKHVNVMLRGIYKVHFSSRLSERAEHFGRTYLCQNCQFSNRYSSVDFGPMLLKREHKMLDHGTIQTFSIHVFLSD